MTDQAHKAEQFRALHIPGKPLILFNVWDAGSTKAVAAAGAKAIATGSWSVAKANGFDDGEQLPLATAIDNLRRIVKATGLPVTVDLESGFGDTPAKVAETVSLAIAAGAIGCNLEDSFPTDGTLRPAADSANASAPPGRRPMPRRSLSSSMHAPTSFSRRGPSRRPTR